jgi:hypothetical protein
MRLQQKGNETRLVLYISSTVLDKSGVSRLQFLALTSITSKWSARKPMVDFRLAA